MNQIIDRLKHLNTSQKIHLGLFLMWFAIGLLTLFYDSSISHISYACVWIVLLVSTLENVLL